MKILGIETSCDETAISVVEAEGPVEAPVFKVLGSALVSQMKLHAEYGGVYPNLAKREHIKNLPTVLIEALRKANLISNLKFPISKKDIEGKIDAIAVTVGPGLEPALWTGINFAEELSKKWNVPLIPTNHMEGHLASVLMNLKDEIKMMPNDAVSKDITFETAHLEFPAIGLLISGGHTELVYLKNWKEKEIIGETKDDAVGEAFDKVARMLGLPYPGGPEISKLAEVARENNLHLDIKFPRPMIHSGDLNFSFSGLKTAVLYYLRDHPNAEKIQVAREFEDAVVEVLMAKSREAILQFHPNTFIIGGGVVANKKIRESFQKLCEEFPDLILKIPEKELATDNATMIAMAGYVSHISGTDTRIEMKAKGNLKYI